MTHNPNPHPPEDTDPPYEWSPVEDFYGPRDVHPTDLPGLFDDTGGGSVDYRWLTVPDQMPRDVWVRLETVATDTPDTTREAYEAGFREGQGWEDPDKDPEPLYRRWAESQNTPSAVPQADLSVQQPAQDPVSLWYTHQGPSEGFVEAINPEREATGRQWSTQPAAKPTTHAVLYRDSAQGTLCGLEKGPKDGLTAVTQDATCPHCREKANPGQHRRSDEQTEARARIIASYTQSPDYKPSSVTAPKHRKNRRTPPRTVETPLREFDLTRPTTVTITAPFGPDEEPHHISVPVPAGARLTIEDR